MLETIHRTRFPTPIGELLLEARAGQVCGLHMHDALPPDAELDEECEANPFWNDVRSQLDAYFSGRSQSFDLPLLQSGTPFQRRVWAELSKIPYGETISYAELARRVGQPTASRAVGGANGRNPIAIIVPCHRVIAADGGLGGFGGGLQRKLWLLQHEAHVVGRDVPPSWTARAL